MKPRKREYLWAVLAFLLAAFVEGRDAQTEARIVAEAKQKADERYAELMFPLVFDVSVTQSGEPGKPARTYFYARSDQ
jgi:hypothetical protein